MSASVNSTGLVTYGGSCEADVPPASRFHSLAPISGTLAWRSARKIASSITATT
jgi:hypothetical protein